MRANDRPLTSALAGAVDNVDIPNAGRQATGLNLQTLRRLKFWVWFQEWIRPTELQVTLIWAGIIGFGGAVCSIAYRVGTSFVHKILTGSSASGLVESSFSVMTAKTLQRFDE